MMSLSASASSLLNPSDAMMPRTVGERRPSTHLRARIVVLASALALHGLTLGGCGGQSASARTSARAQRAALVVYLRQVEPVRLAVNRLLEEADPLLSAYRRGHLSPARAALQMEHLERRFADYTIDIAAISPETPQLRSLHATYAHTYVLEDSYLSALVTGLAERNLAGLPDTQSAQRGAIIEWRTGLAVIARRVALALPPDLQQAGRGEIAPSVGGS
jgi:hypothetical protein